MGVSKDASCSCRMTYGMSDLSDLETKLTAEVAAAADLGALEAVRVAALGKQGAVSALLKTLGSMTPDERHDQGPAINGLRDRVAGAIAERKAELEAAGAGGPARRPGARPDPAGRPAPQGLGPSHPAGDGRDDHDLRRDGLLGGRRPGHRGRLPQLHRPELPARSTRRGRPTTPSSSTRRRTGSASCCAPTPRRCRSAPCSGPTSRRPRPGSPRPRSRRSAWSMPGPHLPHGFGRHPHADVPPDRGAGDRPGHPHGPPEVDAGDLRLALLRDGRA